MVAFKREKGIGLMVRQLEAQDQAIEWQDWRPPEPPCLTGVDEIELDFETTGLKWWAGDKPIGVGYCLPDGTTGYLPFGHQGFTNQLSEEQVKEWMRSEIRGKRINNSKVSFENHMAREWGVNLEDQGNVLSDCQHWGALLEDHEHRFGQDVLCERYLPADERKVLRIGLDKLDGSRMASYPPGMVAVRCESDVRQVHALKKIMIPLLQEQDLMRVKALEDDVIYAVCEMEKNAAPLDVELLTEWVRESEQRYLRYLWKIEKGTGIKFNPSSAEAWEKLFNHLHIPIEERTEDGRMSTQDVLIKKHIGHEYVKLGRSAAKLTDLRSDYIVKYHNSLGPDGLLRFVLHQLHSDDGGTVQGRFSSAAIKIPGDKPLGANIQQVPDPKKEIEKGHDPEFIIRRLFLGGKDTDGKVLDAISADAKQIEYRFFADYARNPRIMKAYEENPDLSFHEETHEMIKDHVSELSYGNLKNLNFASMYMAGLTKRAMMLEFITPQQAAMLRRKYHPKAPPRTEPLLARMVAIQDVYDRMMPEVAEVGGRASHIAKDACDKWCTADWLPEKEQQRLRELHEQYPHQGFVRTLMGRRIRFPRINGLQQRLHKALNGVIQGGSADAMKKKMVIVHRIRKKIGFVPRFPVHDELFGGGHGEETARLLQQALNVQDFPQLKIQIRWDVEVGPNWADGRKLKEDQFAGTTQDATRGGRSR